MLRTSLLNALEVASSKNLSSIAIPAVGTGALNFPADVVANIMFDTVINFSKENSQSSIKEVQFVLYQADHNNIKVRY